MCVCVAGSASARVVSSFGIDGAGGGVRVGQFCRALVQMPLAILFCDNANTVIVNRVLLTVI